MGKKPPLILIASFLATILFLANPVPANAQALKTIWGILTGKEQDLSVFSSALLQGAQDAMMRPLVGCTSEEMVTETCEELIAAENTLPNGAFGYLELAGEGFGGLIENPPLSVKYYAYDIASRLPGNLFNPDRAYAFNFSPIYEITKWGGSVSSEVFSSIVLDMWKVTRNIAYSLIVILLIVVGFMIMPRKKIAPQVVVSVTNALPRLVFGIIFITFSYPIAALTVPLISALNMIVFSAIRGANITAGTGGDNIFGASWIELILQIVTNFTSASAGINLFLGFIILCICVVSFIVGVAIIFTAISRFIKIILAAVFGPLILATGIIPGNEELTNDWFKGLLINTISIPAMIGVYYFGASFIQADRLKDIAQTYAGDANNTQLIGLMIQWFIAINIMWYARKVPTTLSQALKAPAAWVPGVVAKKGR